MNKIKICYVTNSFKNCGPCNVLLSMMTGIDKKKYDVSLLTLLNDNDSNYILKVKNFGINIIEFKYKKSFKTMLKKSEIVNRINNYNFDIIHVHGQITAILTDDVKAKKIITVHNKLYEDFKGLYGPIKGYIINRMYINAMKKFDKVISCSKTSYDVCSKYLKNVSFIHNGMWFEKRKKDYKMEIRNKIRKKFDIPSDAIVYVFAGRYNNAKNVQTMLKYFKNSLKENEYLISLGDGPIFEECKAYCSKKIIQPGFVDNVTDYLMAGDIYVSFSYTEGFPVSIIEALYCGMTLLLSNIDSHIEIMKIDKRVNIGRIFKNDDFESFKKEKNDVNKILKNDSVTFQHKYLSDTVMMKEYEKEYSCILKNEGEGN